MFEAAKRVDLKGSPTRKKYVLCEMMDVNLIVVIICSVYVYQTFMLHNLNLYMLVSIIS